MKYAPVLSNSTANERRSIYREAWFTALGDRFFGVCL
jgi:hypothetical protein